MFMEWSSYDIDSVQPTEHLYCTALPPILRPQLPTSSEAYNALSSV